MALRMQTQMRHIDGTVLLPANSFKLDTNTGFYRIGADNLGVACGGAKVLDVAGQLTQYVGEIKSTTVLSSTIGTSLTLTSADCGKRIYVGVDALTVTLPATVAGYSYEFVNSGADGAVLIALSPNASDAIAGAGLTAVDNKDLLNTKATAKKGDLVRIVGDGGGGWIVQEMTGAWAKEA